MRYETGSMCNSRYIVINKLDYSQNKSSFTYILESMCSNYIFVLRNVGQIAIRARKAGGYLARGSREASWLAGSRDQRWRGPRPRPHISMTSWKLAR